jgi:hypothetical protein
MNAEGVSINGRAIFPEWQQLQPSERLPALYRSSAIQYPKFFKMDSLCRAGFLACELLSADSEQWQDLARDKTALVFSNTASSIDSDRKHAASIQNKAQYFPSPSVFVYTLPNIVLGEIAIRHRITGENAFFISEKFNADTLANYTQLLLEQATTDSAICGWVNTDGDSLDVLVYLVKTANFKEQNTASDRPHNAETIRDIYNR